MNDPYQCRFFWEEKESWIRTVEKEFLEKLRADTEKLYNQLQSRCETVRNLAGLK